MREGSDNAAPLGTLESEYCWKVSPISANHAAYQFFILIYNLTFLVKIWLNLVIII